VTEAWQTFDAVAATYDVVRPDYPNAVFDLIETYCGTDRPNVLEVGPGSGQATEQMARRGWSVLGVEPGADLCELATERLARFPDVELVGTKFEDADLPERSFDAVAAATSWHWVDPTVGYRRAADVLVQGGTLALWWNAHVTGADVEAWRPIREVYEQVAPELADLARLTPDRPDYEPEEEVAASRFFQGVEEASFPFSVPYSPEQFVALTRTYASHRVLTSARRRELESALLQTIADQLGGTVHKPYEAYVVLARRR
jgi:SAM-dependent methyltransferase